MDDDRLANLVAVTALGLTDRVAGALAAVSGLDAVAATALVTLLDFSPAGSVQRMALALGLSHSGAVRLVDRLEGSALVRRRAGSDHRSIEISLTRKGRSLALRLRESRAAETDQALAGLSERQRRDLVRACELVIGNLTRDRLAQRAAGSAPTGGALCRLCDFTACGRPDGRCPTARETGFRP